MVEVPARDDADPYHRWDLSAIYGDVDAWEEAYRDLRDTFPDPDDAVERAERGATGLLDALGRRAEFRTEADRLWWYARLRRTVDRSDEAAGAMFARADALRADVRRVTVAIDAAVAGLTPDEFERLAREDPDLERYREHVEGVLARREHVRDPATETLLADLEPVAQGPYRVHETLTNRDLDFPTVERPGGGSVAVTPGELTELLAHENRGFRRRVHEAHHDAWLDRRELVAETYRTSVDADVRLARARGYDSALEASLDPRGVPIDVYETAVRAVEDRRRTFHRHLETKRRHLGVEDLRPWDWFVPMVEEGAEMPYGEARDAVLAAVEPLGETYRDRAAELFESRRIDVYPGPSKAAMEFTCPAHGAPGYVNLNYRGTVDSALALAHELGHAMHATLAAEAQPPVYGGFDRFLAEIPSNVCEALLADHLLENAGSGSTRRAVVGRYLSRFRTMLVDMTVLAAFERRVHGHVEEGGTLTADWLDEQYADLLGRFYGRDRLDDRIASRWMRMPLLFREEDWPFYAYGYATGMAVGLDVARRILADDGDTDRRYVELLEQGSRGRPVDLVRSLGVDPTGPFPFERAFEVYERYLDVIA